METVIFDQTPLADYLRDEGEDEQQQQAWAPAEPDPTVDTPPPSPPSPSFAPVGRPLVKPRFRNKIPDSLGIQVPGIQVPRKTRLSSLQLGANAVATRIDRADNSKFLEQFRYTIVASQLLSGQSVLGQYHLPQSSTASPATQEPRIPTEGGILLTAAGALAVAWLASWLSGGGHSHFTKKKAVGLLVAIVVAGALSQAYVRQQWLRYVREQALSELAAFVSRSQDFDSVTTAAVALIQEVELVSRGYRLSAPLPPISRIEDRTQTRRCVRLRKALKLCLADAIKKYEQTASVVKGFSEQLDLEKYYDIYDISDFDISDALQGFPEAEFDDPESLRTLKVVAARFHTIRKMFLCALLALEAECDNSDFLRWNAVVEGLRTLNESTAECYERLRAILSEEDMFPMAATPKAPLSPGRERWRSQLRKLNSLTTGIRGLQAKMTLLREESDRVLNETDDVSELGASLRAQYESIGQDLQMLQQAWEEGKVALASGINRNEKRVSSLSMMLSPTTSLSGITTVESGGALEAFKALTGESPPSSVFDGRSTGEPEAEEVFEAVALPRPRSLLTREERLTRMKEDREKRAEQREKADASRGMLKELEMVINLRPSNGRPRPFSTPPQTRNVSL